MKIYISIVLCCFVYTLLSAQSLPIARNYQNAYDNQTRSTDGKPAKITGKTPPLILLM
jgi:hypothetical protein